MKSMVKFKASIQVSGIPATHVRHCGENKTGIQLQSEYGKSCMFVLPPLNGGEVWSKLC